jgi:glycosyltransferase involved in cell wall biosynthesis
MVVPEENGLLFPAGDAGALAAAVEKAWGNPDYLSDMRYSTRQYYECHFAAPANYDALMGIYERVMLGRDGRNARQ